MSAPSVDMICKLPIEKLIIIAAQNFNFVFLQNRSFSIASFACFFE